MPVLTRKQTLPTRLSGNIRAIPSSATDLTAKTAQLFQLVVSNTTAGALTLSVWDKNTSPLALLTAVSFPANSITIMSFPEGQDMAGGIRWQASGSGLVAGIEAYTTVN